MVYPVDSLGAVNDSAFWATYNTPNPLAFRGGQQSVDTTTTVMPSTSKATVVEDKKSGRAGWILLGILGVGATAFCIAAHKKGPEGPFFKRIAEGAKTIFRNGKNKFIPEHPSITKLETGETVVRFAGEKNVLHGDNAVSELGKIGETVPNGKLSGLLDL